MGIGTAAKLEPVRHNITKLLGTFSAGSIVAFCVDEIVGRQCLGAMFASV